MTENILIPTAVYAARVKDRELLQKSSSGGAFTAISDFFLENGHAVACAVYNYKSHRTEFELITNKDLRDQAIGSKYMQSIPGSIYKIALQWLKDNPDKLLLFVGMGCQADGFRKFAEVMHITDRTFIVDIICHGSPSPKLWKEYAKSLEKKHRGEIEYLTFKDKRKGWYTPTAVAKVNGKEISLNEYVKIFYNKCALRPSCHKRPYAATERKTDITIGDFWYIEKTIPDFYDTDGTSVFLIHTERGLELFNNIKAALDFRSSNTEECWQINLERPTEKSPIREQFWSDYQAKGIGFIMKKYGKDTLEDKIKRNVKKLMHKQSGGGYALTAVYAGKYDDENIRAQSRSGGVFTALSDLTLNAGGAVYGCVLCDDFTAVHQRADSPAGRDKMRGSKYIQSNMGETFKSIKADLDNGIEVLFSGTSCQTAGLRAYLGREYDNLFCVDIVCHGVPSAAVWKKYLKWQEEKVNKRVAEVDFRNKKDFGWKAHVESLTMEDGSVVNSTVFTTLFYKHAALRPCCYECPYKDVIHPGDITIADYWGIEKAAPEFDDDKGVSLILVNNEKGNSKLEQCKDALVWKATRLEDSMQSPLIAPFPQPKNRADFWCDFRETKFEKVARKYGDYGLISRIKRKIKNILQ